MPGFVASPFSVRVWIPLTPDVPAPAFTVASELISDGANRNCPSCAWIAEVMAAIIKAVLNRVFMISSSQAWKYNREQNEVGAPYLKLSYHSQNLTRCCEKYAYVLREDSCRTHRHC